MFRIKQLTTFALVILSISTRAEVFSEPSTLRSPNVATLGTFKEPEVALYTGTPSISVPLLEIKLQNTVLPIELQYNGTSIAVEQIPSWVGLGWNLSAGGVITRKINDSLDEGKEDAEHFVSNTDNGILPRLKTGYYQSHGILDLDDWDQVKVNNNIVDTTSFDDLNNFDKEPDEFSFSFPGYNGHFYFNHKGELEVQCSKPVSVKLLGCSLEPPFVVNGCRVGRFKKQPNTFNGFVITIEDGTQFVFGNDTSAVEFSTLFYDPVQMMSASAWYLTKIITPGKQEITFTYARQKFINQMYASAKSTWIEIGYESTPQQSVSYTDYNIKKWVGGNLLSPVFLQSIQTPDNIVRFYNTEANDLKYGDGVYEELTQYNGGLDGWRGNDGRYRYYSPCLSDDAEINSYEDFRSLISQKIAHYKLDRIEVQSLDGIVYKSINMEYINAPSTRLTLASVSFQEDHEYRFEYNSISSLPPYMSMQTDHWGYYNGRTANNNQYFPSREPNPAYIQYGLLTDIIYPTGAKTHLDYEPNTYKKQVAPVCWEPLIEHSTLQVGGGVRIKSILFYDKLSDSMATSRRDYFYNQGYITNPDNSITSGILGTNFVYNYFCSSLLECSGSAFYYRWGVLSAGCVLPYCGSNNMVCYSEVTEKTLGAGYRVYKYTNYTDFLDEAPVGIRHEGDKMILPGTSMRHKRGLLKSVDEYDDSKTLVKKTSYSYTPNKSDTCYARAVSLSKYAYGECTLSIGSAYKNYSTSMVVDTIKETKYAEGRMYDCLTKVNQYNLKTQTLSKSKVLVGADVDETEYVYSFDLLGANYDPNAPMAPLGTYVPQNIREAYQFADTMTKSRVYQPLEIIKRRNGKVVGATYFNYTMSPYGVFNIEEVYTLKTNTPLTSFSRLNVLRNIDTHYGTIPDARYTYNPVGNVVEVVENGIHTSYLWGHHNTRIVGKIVGGSWESIRPIERASFYQYEDSLTSESSMIDLHTTLSTKFPGAMCSTYWYHPLFGMLGEISPNGRTQYYTYDSAGRLTEIYFKNGSQKNILKKYYYHYYEQ